MRAFANLFNRLDQTTRTSVKVEALKDYFRSAPPPDAAWALFFLMGNRLPSAVKTSDLRQWAATLSGLPAWLIEDCHHHVGDLAETLALIIQPGDADEAPAVPRLCQLVEERVLPLRDWEAPLQLPILRETWSQLNPLERLVYNKLLTGAFRVGVSRRLVTRALAELAEVEPSVMAHRLMGRFQPSPASYQALFTETSATAADPARPYPFFLASPLAIQPSNQPDLPPEEAADWLQENLGAVQNWQAEWKWDGIRAQLIKRQGQVFLWSRGEDMLTDAFPEIAHPAARLPDGCVLDGEVLAFRKGAPLPFSILQTRIGRKKLSDAILAEAPVAFLAYDLLEQRGQDIRQLPLRERLTHLQSTLAETPADGTMQLSSPLRANDWHGLADLRTTARGRLVEGLILKRLDSVYQSGRVRGDWWKWKIQPMTLDAILVYAQAGHGRRSGLYTDYTFALRDTEGDGQLVPFAKAYSGLTDEEIKRLDYWIKRNTLARHGPVRVVEPHHVFEIAFDGIAPSTRHKSGLAVRFPRIHRWRIDKPASEADTLRSAREFLPQS